MDINFGKLDKINVKAYSVNKPNTISQVTDDIYEEIDYSKPFPEELSHTPKEKLCFFGEDIVCPSPELVTAYIRKCQNVYFRTDKFNSYKTFRDCLVTDKFTSKPLRDTSYATQGCCEINGVVCITSYDTGYSDIFDTFGKNKKKPSVLSLADSEGRQKNLFFDNYAHVGGIAYHEGSNRAFVPGVSIVTDENGNPVEKKCINIYDTDTFASAKNNEVITPEKCVTLDENIGGVTTASYLTVYGDNLFAGVFEKGGYGTINKYEIDPNGNLMCVSSITPPVKNVQGMCVYKYNNTEYYVFSSSYGRDNDSTLYIGTLNSDGTFTETTRIKMPCMSEQVSVDGDGNLMIVFESDCIKYGDGADSLGFAKANKQVGNVCYLDVEKIMAGVHS